MLNEQKNTCEYNQTVDFTVCIEKSPQGIIHLAFATTSHDKHDPAKLDEFEDSTEFFLI